MIRSDCGVSGGGYDYRLNACATNLWIFWLIFIWHRFNISLWVWSISTEFTLLFNNNNYNKIAEWSGPVADGDMVRHWFNHLFLVTSIISFFHSHFTYNVSWYLLQLITFGNIENSLFIPICLSDRVKWCVNSEHGPSHSLLRTKAALSQLERKIFREVELKLVYEHCFGRWWDWWYFHSILIDCQKRTKRRQI